MQKKLVRISENVVKALMLVSNKINNLLDFTVAKVIFDAGSAAGLLYFSFLWPGAMFGLTLAFARAIIKLAIYTGESTKAFWRDQVKQNDNLGEGLRDVCCRIVAEQSKKAKIAPPLVLGVPESPGAGVNILAGGIVELGIVEERISPGYLLKSGNVKVLESVIGHEISHLKHKDVQFTIISNELDTVISFNRNAVLLITICLAGAAFWQDVLKKADVQKFGHASWPAAWQPNWGFCAALVLATVARKIISQKLHQQIEYRADREAVELSQSDAFVTYLEMAKTVIDCQPAKKLQRVLASDSSRAIKLFYRLRASKICRKFSECFESLTAGHPPIEKRINAIHKHAQRLNLP